MVDLTKCSTAGFGNFEEPPEPPGPTGSWTATPAGPQTEVGIDPQTYPGDGNGGGGTPPDNPTIEIPSDPLICFPQEGPPYTTDIVIKVPIVELENTDTRVSFIDPAEGDTSLGTTVIDLPVAGELLETIGAPPGFSAKLTGLGSSTIEDDFYVFTPTLELTLPDDDNAITFYQGAASDLLNSLSVNGSFILVYFLDFLADGTGNYIEWWRSQTDFTVPIQIVVDDIGDPVDPTIVYEGDLDIIYDVDEDDRVVSVINPTSWSLGNYQLDSVTTTLPLGLVNAGYTQGNVLMTDTTTGSISAFSTPLTSLPETNPDTGNPFELTVSLQFSPVSPYEGDTQEVAFQIPLNVFDGTIDETPSYNQATPQPIITNDADSPRTLIPTSWPTGTTIDYVNIYSLGNDPDQLETVTYDGGTVYQWDALDGQGHITSDNNTGEITFASIPTDFDEGNLPYRVQVIAFYDGDDYIFSFNIVISTGGVGGGSPGGGGGGTDDLTMVINSNSGSRIRVPSNLRPLDPIPAARTIPSLVPFNARQFTQRTRPLPLSAEVEANKRLRTSYSDGVNDARFTFFSDNTITAPLNVPYNKKYDNSLSDRVSVLGESVDETVAAISNINNGYLVLNDYPYNAITEQKVKNSFSPRTKLLLSNIFNLDGTKFEDSLASFVRKALIQDEVTNFLEKDLDSILALNTTKEPTIKTNNIAEDNLTALNLMLENLLSINPYAYNIKAKNRLLNWKTLAEDVNKHLIFKTADGTETKIFIPNNEKITVGYGTGKTTTLEMQDGDFFTVNTVDGNDRLTVHSDTYKAYVLSPDVVAKAAYLASDDLSFQFDVTSVSSDLVEYNVDTTSARQDYYFLYLDKDTITDDPTGLLAGDTLFSRKTSATYRYTTTGIDDIVKHKAFPNFTLYLREDDMFFNHLESSENISVTFKDLTFNNFNNLSTDKILVRQLPQHIVIIPTDRTENVFSHERSRFVDFTTRRITARLSPDKGHLRKPGDKPKYLMPVFTDTESINFDFDIQDNIIWRESVKYVFDTTAVEGIDRYRNETQTLPRKETPITKVIKELNNIRTVYDLGSTDSINTFDLFSRIQPSDLKSLSFTVDDGYKLLSRLNNNSITEDATVNDDNFIRVQSIAAVAQEPQPVEFLPENDDAPQVTSQKQQTATKGGSK